MSRTLAPPPSISIPSSNSLTNRSVLRTTRFAKLPVIAVVFSAATSLLMSNATAQTPPAETGKAAPADDFPERILREWYEKTSQVQMLQGECKRWHYDFTFAIEKRAQGYFYYMSPDRGRIDFNPSKPKRGEVSRKKDKTGQPYQIRPDTGERWICDGEQLKAIDDENKKVEVFPIPVHGRGRNIMEGPLPFLLGMPPTMARSRYHLKLLKETPQEVWIAAVPKWPQDRRSYSGAKVILNRKTYLPVAVQVMDPGGRAETVYTFSGLKVNVPPKEQGSGWFKMWNDNDPFRPSDIEDYKITVQKVENKVNENSGPQVPSVINLRWDAAKKNLETVGYKLAIKRGRPTNIPNMQYVVYEQTPVAMSSLPKGGTVVVTVYDKASEKKTAEATNSAAAPAGPTVPEVGKLTWEQAKAKLQAAGYAVKLHQGPATTDPKLMYRVVSQTPAAGAPLAKGKTVVITVYDKQR